MKKVTVVASLFSLFLVWLSYSLGSHAGLYSTHNKEVFESARLNKPVFITKTQVEKGVETVQKEEIQETAQKEEIQEIVAEEIPPSPLVPQKSRIPTSESPFFEPLVSDFENNDFLSPQTEDAPEHFSQDPQSILENVDFYIFAFEIRDFARNFSQEVHQFRQEYKVDAQIKDEELIFTVANSFARTLSLHVYVDGGQEYLGELNSTSVPTISEENLLLLADKRTFQKDKRRLVIKKPKEDILPRELETFFNVFTHPLQRESYIETDELTHFDIYEINPVLYVLERF